MLSRCFRWENLQDFKIWDGDIWVDGFEYFVLLNF